MDVDKIRTEKENSSRFVTIMICICFLIAVIILAKGFTHKARLQEVISVTGLAEKEFTSDLVYWNGSFTRKSMDLKTAYALLKKDESSIKSYLTKKDITAQEMVFSAVNIKQDFTEQYNSQTGNRSSVFNGYILSQTISVESKNLDKIEKLSREVTELIEEGIEFNSSSPSYFFSGLSKLKLSLLSQASNDAYLRADSIAKNSRTNLGNLKKANMGVFQILGKNSNDDFSEGGTFNTSSREKKASITVKAEYSVD